MNTKFIRSLKSPKGKFCPTCLAWCENENHLFGNCGGGYAFNEIEELDLSTIAVPEDVHEILDIIHTPGESLLTHPRGKKYLKKNYHKKKL